MLKCADIFGNHMILQRREKIKIWGKTDACDPVFGEFGIIQQEVLPDANGNWQLEFPKQEAKKNVKIRIKQGNEEILFSDIAIGEVWLAGGQSNMEYYLYFDEEINKILEKRENSEIRFYGVPQVCYEGEKEEFCYDKFGFWRKANKEDLPYFSAVAYYFAEKLYEILQVPIGIIGCNWGGTPAAAWMKKSYLENNKGRVWIEEYLQACKQLTEEEYLTAFYNAPIHDRTNPWTEADPEDPAYGMMYPGLSREKQLKLLESPFGALMAEDLIHKGPRSEKRPGCLYHYMLETIAPYAIKGVIWYQGEDDSEHAEIYDTVLSNMIQCWRDLWEENLDFYMVQLAPFEKWMDVSGDNYPLLRKKQEIVAKEMTHVWLCSNSDAGLRYDIHPKKKRPVGERLAKLALVHSYGFDILGDAPELSEVRLMDGELRIIFKNGKGLHLVGNEIHALKIIPDSMNEELLNYTYKIENNALIIQGNVGKQGTIYFAETPYYEVNLYNSENIPAKPFVQRY